MEVELHLFIVWSKARMYEADCIELISSEFEILSSQLVTWDRNSFSLNLSRLYGESLPRNSHKERHCGIDPFRLIVVRDKSPAYDMRRTSTGLRLVNTRMFDIKQRLRGLSGGGHKIHATDDTKESREQLYLFFLKDFAGLEASCVESDLIQAVDGIAGQNGWRSIEDVFSFLSINTNYVIMRNFDQIGDIADSEHPDVDLLVWNEESVARKLAAVKSSSLRYRSQYVIQVAGREVYVDLRSPVDNYFDENMSRKLLADRYFSKDIGAYILTGRSYFYSLLYHVLVHKPGIAQDYYDRLYSLGLELSVCSNKTDMAYDNLVYILDRYLSDNNWKIVEPFDLSVHFNHRILQRYISFVVSRRRLNFENWLSFRKFIRKVLKTFRLG